MCPPEPLAHWSQLVGAAPCLTPSMHCHTQTYKQLSASRYVWPGINIDVQRWAWVCLQCQRSKVQRHTITPCPTFATPDVRCDKIHIDIVGLLPRLKGHNYLLTCFDRFTHWPEAISISDITAETVAQAFVRGWIARFGVPSTVTTDRGRQLESKKLMQLLGSKCLQTTAYHPISNGVFIASSRQP